MKDFEKEFSKTIRTFINKYLSNNTKKLKGIDDNIKQENYLTKLEEYFKNDTTLMDNIIEKAKQFIDYKGNKLIEEIYKKSYVNKNSIDLISILIDYIREKLVSQNIMDIFENLEDNNFITSLLVLNNKNEKNELSELNEDIIDQIKENFMKQLKLNEKNNYDVKFDLNYIVPGFYNIIRELSNIISKNYSGSFIQNETQLRKFLKGNKEDALINFFDTESNIIEQLYIELQNDKNKKIFDVMNGIKIPENLFFNDYFNFYLDKYYYNHIDMNINNNYENSCYLSYGNHKVLNLLLKLRFQENKKNSEENDDNINDENDDNNEDNFKFILKKICWLESNVNYIIDIVVIYNELKQHFQKEQKNDENEEKLFKIMENNMKDLNIKYITNEDKNPLLTKYVNDVII